MADIQVQPAAEFQALPLEFIVAAPLTAAVRALLCKCRFEKWSSYHPDSPHLWEVEDARPSGRLVQNDHWRRGRAVFYGQPYPSRGALACGSAS